MDGFLAITDAQGRYLGQMRGNGWTWRASGEPAGDGGGPLVWPAAHRGDVEELRRILQKPSMGGAKGARVAELADFPEGGLLMPLPDGDAGAW